MRIDEMRRENISGRYHCFLFSLLLVSVDKLPRNLGPRLFIFFFNIIWWLVSWIAVVVIGLLDCDLVNGERKERRGGGGKVIVLKGGCKAPQVCECVY